MHAPNMLTSLLRKSEKWPLLFAMKTIYREDANSSKFFFPTGREKGEEGEKKGKRERKAYETSM